MPSCDPWTARNYALRTESVGIFGHSHSPDPRPDLARGQGKRGGARTIVATKLAERWFFLYGFSKNERSNIDNDELRALQEVAKDLLGFDDRQLDIALRAGEILEVRDGDDKA